MVDVIIAMILGIVIGAFGIVIWALNVVQKRNREVTVVEDKLIPDQESIKAINTVRQYCNCRYCCDCAIRKVCQEYFDNSDGYPDDWPEMEGPHDR